MEIKHIPEQPVVQRRNQKRIKKYTETNGNRKISCQKLEDNNKLQQTQLKRKVCSEKMLTLKKKKARPFIPQGTKKGEL